MFCILTVGCGREPEDAVNPVQESSSEQQLQELIKKYPDSLLLKENLIQYFRENGHYDNALREVNRAIAADSNTLRLWDIKAILHAENEDTASAIKAFERALDIEPSPEDVVSLGTLYAETANPKALEMADALLLADKASAVKEAVFIKGLYYSSSGNKTKAIQFFDECIKLNYSFMYAYREKCIALYDLGKYEDALTTIRRATSLQNKFEEGYFFEGRCLEKLNRPVEAVEAYQTALMYAPDYVEARDALAKLGVKT